jgi:hypothetical protein
MNILFLISNDGNQGVGGHFNSLNQISREIGTKHNVSIITFGLTSGPIIGENPYFDSNIIVRKGLKGLLEINKKISRFKKKFKPEIIHCFDTQSLNRILLVPSLYNLPIVMNKCGGGNPLKSNYQHADAIVVFSLENQEWFLSNKNYCARDIFLIPNRVQELKLISEEKRVEKKSQEKTTFLRISRLGGAYDKTLLDTFNLIEKLTKEFDVELYVVGKIENQTKFSRLVKIGEEKNITIHYINDERVAKASDFLYLADFVIGTGRSFMEAISLGIPTLAPASNSNIPVLVNKSNFADFFEFNFSERSIIKKEVIDANYNIVKTHLLDYEVYNNSKNELKKLFLDFFGTDLITIKYNAVYDFVVNKNNRTKLILKNLPYLVRYVFFNK